MPTALNKIATVKPRTQLPLIERALTHVRQMGLIVTAPKLTGRNRTRVRDTLEYETRDASALRLVQIMAGRVADDAMIERAMTQLIRVCDGIDEVKFSSASA